MAFAFAREAKPLRRVVLLEHAVQVRASTVSYGRTGLFCVATEGVSRPSATRRTFQLPKGMRAAAAGVHHLASCPAWGAAPVRFQVAG